MLDLPKPFMRSNGKLMVVVRDACGITYEPNCQVLTLKLICPILLQEGQRNFRPSSRVSTPSLSRPSGVAN